MIIFQGIARVAQCTIQRVQTLLQPRPKLFHQFTVSNHDERVPPLTHFNERQAVCNWNAVQQVVFGGLVQPACYCELGCIAQVLTTNVGGGLAAGQLSLDGVGCVFCSFASRAPRFPALLPQFCNSNGVELP